MSAGLVRAVARMSGHAFSRATRVSSLDLPQGCASAAGSPSIRLWCSGVGAEKRPHRLAGRPRRRPISSRRSRNLQTHSSATRLPSEDGLWCLVRRQRVDRTYGRDFLGSSGQRQRRATRQCDQAACLWSSKLLEESAADMAELGISLKIRFAKHALSRPCATSIPAGGGLSQPLRQSEDEKAYLAMRGDEGRAWRRGLDRTKFGFEAGAVEPRR